MTKDETTTLRRLTRPLGAVLLVFLPIGAWVVHKSRADDRCLAMEAAGIGNTRLAAKALACRAPTGYPADLAELASAQGQCPGVEWVGLATPEGAGLRYGNYVWFYTPQRLPHDSRVRGFQLRADSRPAGTRRCPRCRSLWMDESEVIRWARGRPGRAGDPELKLE